MKVAVISDIHIDEQESEDVFEKVFADCINRTGADYLLIAGDISEYYLRTLAFIRRFKEKISPKIYFCAGNHDIWSKFEPGLSVQDVIDYMKGEKGDKGFLQNQVVQLTEKTVLIAGCGWYDYTFAHPNMFTYEHLKEKEYKGRWWRDSRYANHGVDDDEVNHIWNNELTALVEQYADYDIIFMTHMLNHPSFLVGETSKQYEMFKYFNAFLGSDGLYKITKKGSVKYAISGHVHYRRSFTEDSTYYMCRCLGYPREFLAFGGEQQLEAQIMDAIEVIKIE